MRRSILALASMAGMLSIAASTTAYAGKPLNILPPAARAAVFAGVVGGATTLAFVTPGIANPALGSLGGFHPIGVAGPIGFGVGVAALIGYEAIGCKTLGIDPFSMCLQHSWRVPGYH